MEFTRLLKYGSAALFLILLAHGLILGFSIPTTIISVVLVLICFLMEQKLVLHEREELNTKYQQKLTELLQQRENDHAEFQRKLDTVHSQLSTLKTASGITSIRRG